MHLTYIDDYFPAVYGHTDHVTAKAFIDRLVAMLVPAAERPVARVPAERLVADLWERTAGPLDPARAEPMRRAAVRWLRSHLWEHHHNHTGQLPDPVDFVEMSRSTFGGDFMLAMIHGRHPAIPAVVYASAAMTMLDNTVRDIFRLMNELISYPKETQHEGEIVNGLVVFGRFLNLDSIDEAAAVVSALLDSRVAQLRRIVDHELPALARRRGLPAEVIDAMDAYAATMRDWVAGVAHWHRETLRYSPSHVRARYRRLRHRALSGPCTVPAHHRPDHWIGALT